jgi:D-alanyl-lipoteichoic acid acyltransferase DltB (MBOAT superfamily)
VLFNSWIFFLFLPLVFTAFFALPHKFRGPMLLVASYVFYGWWKAEFLIIIAFSTLLDYYCALKLSGSEDKSVRKRWMLLSIGVNLGILFLFKYFYFFIGSSDLVQELVNPHQKLKALVDFFGKSLPVGISFYTFQTMSYTLDVYYRRAVPERNLTQFALFVSYFPQLVAGPIERFSHLNEQLKKQAFLKYEHLQNGFRLMLYGFFVKMVIADNLSYTVTSVFNEPGKWVYYWNLIGVFSFGFQIYADFFGYSLIAQGVAKLFGIDLMDNFNRPYLSENISSFWGRWHISLSTWFRDYLYIPMGGNRVNTKRWILNILLVFLLSGLWHGANYTFLVWGGLHGLYYLIQRFSPIKIAHKLSSGVLTFLAVSFAWIFFRAKDLKNATEVIKGMSGQLQGDRQLDTQPYVFLLLFIFGAIELARGDRRFDAWAGGYSVVKRWALYCFVLFCILALSGSEYSPFIYFRF